MKFDLFPVVGTMIELNSHTKLAINTSYRLNCKWDIGLYKMWLIIAKEIVTMTTTGLREMSSPSLKFSDVGSKFLCFIYMSHSSGPICLSRTIPGVGGGCHSTVKPAKKSFVMVMFQHSVSNLLSHLSSIIYNVFYFFLNSFPKVLVV